jgi:protocatechuate 4,5-dioxygenase, alpha chain
MRGGILAARHGGIAACLTRVKRTAGGTCHRHARDFRRSHHQETVTMQPRAPIPGTIIFDGEQAQKGYALNRMCFSFNSKDNRENFRKDEEAYMRAYGLDARQTEAIRNRDVLGLLKAGGNVYYLAKFAGILGLDVQDLGSLQTGLSKEAFKARLVQQNEQPERFGA